MRRCFGEDGKNLRQLISEARFELARQLLHNTELPVEEIATALQYADPNAFYRVLRNWAQLRPT